MGFLGINTKKLGKALGSISKIAYKPVALVTVPALAVTDYAVKNPSVIPVPGAGAAGKVVGGKLGINVLSQLSSRGEVRLKADPVLASGKEFLRNKKQYVGFKVGVGLAGQGGTLGEVAKVRNTLGKEQRKGFDLSMAAAAGEKNKSGHTPREQFKSMVKGGVKRAWWTRFLKWLRFEK